MKIYIAYALVVIGIPYFIGLLFGRILILPISMIRGVFRQPTDAATQAQEFIAAHAWAIRGRLTMPMADRIVHVCLDMLNGLGAVLTAGFIFHLFGLPPGVAILLILAAWEIFFTVAYGQALRVLFGSLAGLIIGWFVVLRLFSA